MKTIPDRLEYSRERWREHRRRRFRRHGRRAYIRSVYFLPSLATLGNAICGFGAMYVAALDPQLESADRWTRWFAGNHYSAAALLIFLAMVFDALDGRLARFTRHTTDFGGQLDSLADMISFGAAPAFVALQLIHEVMLEMKFFPVVVTRLIWAAGALYMSCAAMRLARFNVSNEHGEQHHFSFLGLPSPGAAATVGGFILMQQDLLSQSAKIDILAQVARVMVFVLPFIVLATGLLMISNIRYPHVVNRYLRGKRSIGRLISAVALILLFLVAPRYVLGIGSLCYAAWGPTSWSWLKIRPRPPLPPPSPST